MPVNGQSPGFRLCRLAGLFHNSLALPMQCRSWHGEYANEEVRLVANKTLFIGAEI